MGDNSKFKVVHFEWTTIEPVCGNKDLAPSLTCDSTIQTKLKSNFNKFTAITRLHENVNVENLGIVLVSVKFSFINLDHRFYLKTLF